MYDFILNFVHQKKFALDCATGNGQVAGTLALHFRTVSAIDISARQLSHAVRLDNIEYAVCRAEQTPFDENSFDLITVAQAYHWFDGPRFFREAQRVARRGAVIAIWGYDLAYCNSPIDALVRHWNYDILARYWEPERKHVYTHYKDLPFEFDRIPAPEFEIIAEWDREELVGHLRTWSALQTMIRQEGDGAFQEVVAQIRASWGNEGKKRFVFPLFLHLGRVRK